jgi:acetolactate synthase-1/2/3 large subunit
LGTKTIQVETVAQAYLELLRDRGVEYVFGNVNTSLVDAFARLAAQRKRSPRPVMVAHEYPAVAMAHGYAMVSGRPQVVMVHSTVGTANGVGAIINAARSQTPMLFTAARSPVAEDPDTPGARDIHVHWAQESFDQGGMLREYVKWDYELRSAAQLEAVIDRALEIALAEPRGPVYLTLPRDLMAQPLERLAFEAPSRRRATSRRFPDPARIEEAAEILARSRAPLVITSEVGRDAGAAAALVALAETGAIEVLEASPVYANFPVDHPSHAGFVFGSQVYEAIRRADAILVVDCDAPWFAARVRPRPGAKVIQLAVDPLFSRYPMRNYPCDVPIAAEPAVALPFLVEALRRRARRKDVSARRKRLEVRHRRTLRGWARAAEAERGRVPIGFQWASKCIGEVLDSDTIVVNEYPLDLRHAPARGPGTYFGAAHSGGLGWGFGAALGAKLARPDRTVIATLGDGSYIFGVPSACHQASRMHDLPLLTIVFNNGAWEEVRKGTTNVHPRGWAASTGHFPFAALEPSPRFEEIVRAFDGYGERVESPDELPAALSRALDVVRKEGRQALLNVVCRR